MQQCFRRGCGLSACSDKDMSSFAAGENPEDTASGRVEIQTRMIGNSKALNPGLCPIH